LKFLDRLHPLALLVLRLGLGIIMTAHGWQKLSGGLGKFMGFLSNIGVPGWMAYLVVAAEFGGGILLIAGLLTRLAALSIFVDMAVAIAKYHGKNGLLTTAPGRVGRVPPGLWDHRLCAHLPGRGADLAGRSILSRR